jgi:hypothetical protein
MALEYACLSYTRTFRERSAEEVMKRARAHHCEHHGPESIIPRSRRPFDARWSRSRPGTATR